ncbi:sporulation protein Cse60 [Litchfieldia alkalitelluris]|uniref:sporulation protein Cse60 n=1 Tax=Litchfieldia alkalitelluris TaxID=304268 RepID=UPI0009982CED|nr:sporulation protein Cse60 [Litchfieldia alkalitelluris]
MYYGGDKQVRVKIIDESHEQDLEVEVNRFLEKLDDSQVVDIKYQVACSTNNDDEQIYCFSACVIYRD